MKRTIIFASILLFGCKKETPQPTNCQCRIVTFIQGNQGYWSEQSSIAPQPMSCALDGDIVQTWTVVEPAWTAYYKKQIVCE